MEFLTQHPTPPTNLYPCLATITVTPHGAEGRYRRRSSASYQPGEEDNALMRVISGGRRRSMAGNEERRPSTVDNEVGTWYWRVQAGANNGQLVLLPLSQPANPVLTSRPAPLSQVMPAHSATAQGAPTEHEGLGAKIKHLFSPKSHDQALPPTAESQAAANGVDPILDQTPGGQVVPTADANAVGATNLNADAETSWPGQVQGKQLEAIVVDLRAVDQHKVQLTDKKKEGSAITVPVSASVISAMLEPVGSKSLNNVKSGVLRFEFDKDWIGAKGEAELLHHSIINQIEAVGFPHSPVPQSFQLRGNNNQLSGE